MPSTSTSSTAEPLRALLLRLEARAHLSRHSWLSSSAGVRPSSSDKTESMSKDSPSTSDSRNPRTSELTN
eukprot:5005798-Prymnesium_polylepis.2